jgi:hypothetical protein
MISTIALGASVLLFLVAAGDQWLVAGNVKVAALYGCFSLTNAVALWIGTSK